MSYSRKHLLSTPLLMLALLFSSCVTFVEQQDTYRPEEGVVLLFPEAKELLNAQPGDLFVVTSNTVEDIPLTSRLIHQVANMTGEAVVSVYVTTSTTARISLLPIPGWGTPVEVPGSALGSGFFIHPSGYLLTNDHVIKDADEIKVKTWDGDDFEVSVIARDPTFDLALLRVVDAEREFPTLPMGDSEEIGVGDFVIAVGNPLGLGHTVTQGIISQTGRNLEAYIREQQPEEEEDTRRILYLQTSTAINPGSSGGPLITLTGAWIGVNTAGITEAQNIGFAVPSGQVREFLDNVRSGNGETLPTETE
jgi:S1-C subfamily serine protease